MKTRAARLYATATSMVARSVAWSTVAAVTNNTTTGRIAKMTTDTPVYDQLQKHWSQMQDKAKLEARVALVKELKSIKKPVKQVIELIKEYEKNV